MILKSFGKIKEFIPKDVEINQSFEDFNQLKSYLENLYPELIPMQYLIAIDHKIIDVHTILTENSEISLLPPFSGG